MGNKGQPAGNGRGSKASPSGGWKPSRASWLGMVAVVTLAAIVLALGTVIAAESSTPDTAGGIATEANTSSVTVSPTTIGSSWSMAPSDDEDTIVSATDVAPNTVSASMVFAPR